ncbi:MAG: Integrase family protein [Pedosphaera sp.]|nr:Integrase family protein [Pedosphaera sp.]
MKGIATENNVPAGTQGQNGRSRQHREHKYHRVVDERKRPIRGLWVRNNRYYAQLTIEDAETGHKKVRRVPLEKATSPAQARDQLQDLLVTRRKGKLPILKRTPKFLEFADGYLAHYKQAKDAKKASTLETEEICH